MERKVQKIIILFLVFFILFLGGCKEERKQEGYKEEKELEGKTELVIDSKISKDLIKEFRDKIEKYIIEERTEEYGNFRISWREYTIYFKNSFAKYFVLPKLTSNNYSLKKLKFGNDFEKYNLLEKVYISEKESKLINILTLFFPMPKKNSLEGKPKVAFIVDDVVEDNYWTERLLKFTYVLNISIIPTRKTEGVAEKIVQKGWEVMLHLPMESIIYPRDAKYLISEAIMVGMEEEKIDEILKVHLSRFGKVKIKWVNNHMGSKVTADLDTMEKLLKVFKKYHLGFLDSKTIYNSVGMKIAKKVGVPSLENMLFIDHENDKERIRQRFIQSIDIAKKRGWGVFIFHLRPYTIEVLEELDKENFFSQVELVKISDLFEEVNSPLGVLPQESQNKFSQ